jgi:MSHA biogenesis protein MshJ
MMKTPDLSSRLRALGARIDARSLRERVLLCGAAAAIAFMLIDALLFGPALKTWQNTTRQQQEAQASIARLQAEASQRLAAANQQQRQQQAELATWRQRVREGEAQLRSYEATLIGPDQMLPVLDKLLASHGQLKLRNMQPLARTDLLAGAANVGAAPMPSGPTLSQAVAATGAANAAQRAPTAAALPDAGKATDAQSPTLYRHGVQLTVEGSFADLLTYVQALEAMPQRMLWGDVNFKVEQYPRAALTLQLYTISRDRHWLEI